MNSKLTPSLVAFKTFAFLSRFLAMSVLTGCTIYANSDRETFNTRAVVQNPHGAVSANPDGTLSENSCGFRISPQSVAVRCHTPSITKDQTIVRVSR